MSYISKIETIIDKFTHTRTGRTTMNLLRGSGISPAIRKRLVLFKMAKETKLPTDEKLLYKYLPETLFIRLFHLSHICFMKKSNKLSLKNESNKYM